MNTIANVPNRFNSSVNTTARGMFLNVHEDLKTTFSNTPEKGCDVFLYEGSQDVVDFVANAIFVVVNKREDEVNND